MKCPKCGGNAIAVTRLNSGLMRVCVEPECGYETLESRLVEPGPAGETVVWKVGKIR